jgi:NAD(P)-dependent dehydrogenase (short-subunit alcohol dehydrogenase family)
MSGNGSDAAFDLSGRVAIVTGGGTGIGAATAGLLAAHGADVVIAARTLADLEAVAGRITVGTGRRVLPVVTDVKHPDAVDHMVERTMSEFGRIDILVNNAGGTRLGPLESLPLKGWDAIFDLNLRGAFLCTQAAGHHMLEAGSGAIVNVSSAAGITGVKGGAHYSAAKAGLQMFTSVTAAEWGPRGVRANCVAVGLVASERAVAAWDVAGIDPDAVAAVTPVGRAGMPIEVAYPILFLVSDAASYVNGQTFAVDGGAQMPGNDQKHTRERA